MRKQHRKIAKRGRRNVRQTQTKQAIRALKALARFPDVKPYTYLN